MLRRGSKKGAKEGPKGDPNGGFIMVEYGTEWCVSWGIIGLAVLDGIGRDWTRLGGVWHAPRQGVYHTAAVRPRVDGRGGKDWTEEDARNPAVFAGHKVSKLLSY